ncbi:substrate-binding domain-containing protein [uncultured Maribacter sp.]|uniref:substrate-binding domain-containing protein n=1 Tax=uncultured Maribacter sp. TaxID=431308 RepID=UPI00262B5A92|nr:substrate-binding domain-containing protein [uncultured Maribacter sp.]
MTQKKMTIKDIAKLAGVSKGTVDRVLHKRGKVSKEALEKVEKILKEIEYQPNPIARNLKENKVYKISILIPDYEIDIFWKPAHEGIKEAEKEFGPFGVLVEKFIYNPFQKEDFHQKSIEAISVFPNLLLITPLFEKESFLISKTCKKKNIKVALFNNHIKSKNAESYVGQDLIQSGKIAADLIYKTSKLNCDIGIVHINLEPHLLLKEQGFKNYFSEKNSNIRILESTNFNTNNQTKFVNDITIYLKAHPKLGALFITNSHVHEVAEIVSKINKDCAIIGYDLIPKNVTYLKKGKINFLIHQRPKEQAYLSISYYAEYFLFGKKVPLSNLLPIDIITSENVDYYL